MGTWLPSGVGRSILDLSTRLRQTLTTTSTIHRVAEPRPSLVQAERYAAALAFPAYLESVVKNREWWQDTYRLATVREEHATRASALPSSWKLVAITEDWCGDAVNILPFVARLVEAAPETLEMRLLGRDANPDLMNAHLTEGRTRSIPSIIVLDGNYLEYGWWGPRPMPLQEQAMGDWWQLPKDERRLRIRKWYARDRGRQIHEELLRLLEGMMVARQQPL